MTEPTCSIAGCEKPRRGRGWCLMHYKRWKNHGDTTTRPRGVPVTDPLVRLQEKLDKNGPVPGHAPELGPCWLWMAATTPKGYGLLTVAKRKRYAHRLAYELMVGPIPNGLVLDHLCRVPRCVNPTHLEPVTNAENIRRGYEAKRSATAYKALRR